MSTNPATETTTCQDCGTSFLASVIQLGGQSWKLHKRCSICALAFQRLNSSHRTESERREEAWLSLCPPLYRDTDPARLPARLADIVEHYNPGERGLGIIGKPGAGKTRAAYLALRKHHDAGRSVLAISAVSISRLSADQFARNDDTAEDARKTLQDARTRSALLIDDLGKGRLTDRAEMELYDLLEHRTSHLLPTIWTANTDSHSLGSMLSEDRGAAIIRRLSEFGDIVRV